MIRKLDRYILKAFCVPFFVFCFLVMCLYVIIDCFGRLDDFSQFQEGSLWKLVFKYYFWTLPFVLSQWLLPIITLISSVFCFSTLNKHNELIAIKASGIPMQRQFLPIVFIVCCICLFDYALKSHVVPKAYDHLEPIKSKLSGEINEWGQKKSISSIITTKTGYEIWYVAAYTPRLKRANGVYITKLGSGGEYISHATVLGATYKEGKWHSTKVYMQNNTKEIPTLVEIPILDSEMTLKKLMMHQKDPQYMTSEELSLFPGHGQWHLEKMARPVLSLSSLILFLWGLVVIFGASSGNFFLATCNCVLMTFGYYAIVWLVMQIGSLPNTNPVYVVYGPMGLLLLLGFGFFYKLRT